MDIAQKPSKSGQILDQRWKMFFVIFTKLIPRRRPSDPKTPKKSQKGLPEPPGPECRKSVEEVPKDPKKSQKGLENECSGTFSTLF